VYVEILIETNVLNPIEESMSTLGIEEGIYVYVDSDSNINDEMWVWIQSNTLNGDASSYYGIEAYGEDANVCFVITLNTVDMFEYGIYAEYGNMEITHNTVTNAWEIGIYVYDVWGVVSDNTVTDCYYGIDIDYVYDLVVSDNVITTTWEMEMSDGIYVYNADNLTIEDNIIDGYEYGMEVYYADNSLITGNTVLNSMYDAVYLYYCEYTEFTDNLVQTGYDDGVYVGSCYDFIVADNVISDFMDDGLRIYNSNRVIVADNEIFDVMDDGLDIQNSYDIELYNGLFYDCGDYAVYGSSYSMIWYIDDVAEVRNSPVYFEGDVIVQDGGWLNTDFVSSFDVVDDYYDGVPAIVVEEGGLLTATNTVFGGYWYYTNGYAWLFDVLGAMEMDNSWIYGAYQLYCGPDSSVTIHASVIAYNVLNGVYVDNCDPVLAFVEIHSNGGAGVFITGEAAEPVIKDCIITYNERGIYAYEASLGQVIDNLIIYNYLAGIYVEGVTGEIHDNILMFNQREIFVLSSEVTIEDNQIGYSVLIEIMAEYWPLIMSELSESPLSSWSFSPEDILSMMSNHIGVYVEDSVVECSDNVYGMLSYALYAVDSDVLFMDSVEMSTLVIPYFDEFYSMYNITLPIFVYDGIFASGSEIDVMSAYIEVLDDAVFLEATEAVVNSCEFDAGDFDLYAMDGSTVDVYGTELDKVKAEDTSTVDVWAVLTVYTVDPDGNAVVAYVMVFDSVHTYPMAEGNSSEDGVFAVTVMTAEWTSAGQDTSFNPYTVNAHFEGGNAVDTVTVDGPTEVTLQDPGPPTSEVDVGVAVAIAVLGGIVLIIALLTLAVRP